MKPKSAEAPGPVSPASGSSASAIPDVATCPHCGTAVEDEVDAFCCAGCEMAHSIITGAGLERYYRDRERTAPRPEPLAGGWDALPVEPDGEGRCELRLAVDGLRCASCVWVTENVLRHTVGVEDATVSYATGRATLRWDPERVRLGELAARIAGLGYRPRLLGEEATPDRDLLTRMGVAGFAAANIMLLSAAGYAGWFDSGMAPQFQALFRWASLLLATPVALWCAAPFFSGARAGLRAGVLHMDVPIAIAVAVLYGHGVVGTLAGFDSYLDSLGMLVALLLAGRVLESRGRRRAAEAAVTLAARVPLSARKVVSDAGGDASGGPHDARIVEVPSAELEPGDRIVVPGGSEVPADGIVEEGQGLLRVALVTGEAEPVSVKPGSEIWAGTVLLDGALTVRVDCRQDESVLGRMARELEAAADRGSAASSTDRIAPGFTAATLLIAAAVFVGWSWTAGIAAAVPVTVAVLVVACPCALALSRPLASAAGLGAAARRGLLFRSAAPLLELARVDVVALDKTGTVTGGRLSVTSADTGDLRIAAGLERFSAHPIAEAVIRAAADRGIPLPRAEDVEEVPGEGISGVVDGRRWRLRSGSAAGVVVLEDEDGHRGLIRLGDRTRADSSHLVAELREEGFRVVLLTGDHPEVARQVAAESGIDEVLAARRPDEKAAWVLRERERGRKVLFVGDGLNDGPALVGADVGVAMGTGVATSVLAADGVLVGSSLRPLLRGVRAARACERAIRTNQLRSILYNVTAVSAAAAGLINPLIAAVLMPLSSGMVVWGASRVEARMRRHS